MLANERASFLQLEPAGDDERQRIGSVGVRVERTQLVDRDLLEPAAHERFGPAVSPQLVERHEGVLRHPGGRDGLDLIGLGVAARRLARDAGRLVREPGDRKDEALAILRTGTVPRGVAEAPRFVTPPANIDLDLARQLLAEVSEARTALAADLDALRAAPRAIPHQALGDLTGPEWVRFAHIHTNHHLAIVDEVLASVS